MSLKRGFSFILNVTWFCICYLLGFVFGFLVPQFNEKWMQTRDCYINVSFVISIFKNKKLNYLVTILKQ